MKSAWIITAKDLYLLSRDRRSFAVLLLLPLVFIVIIGLTTGKLLGWRSSNQMLKIALVDQVDYEGIGSPEFLVPPGETAASPPQPLAPHERERERRVAGHLVADIVNGMQRTPGVEVLPVVDWQRRLDLPQTSDADQAARRMLANEQVNAVLLFKPDFHRRIYHSDITDLAARKKDESSPAMKLGRVGVELASDDPNSTTTSAITAILAYQLRDVIEPVLTCRSEMVGNLTVPQRASAKYRRLCGPLQQMETTPPSKLLPVQTESNPAVSNTVYEELVPAYTVMFVFFIVNVMAHSFLHERQIGTMRRLGVAPISGWSILFGKTVPFLIVSLTQTAILFIAGRLLFGMSWGPYPWMLIPVAFTTSAAAVGLGLLIATLVRSDSQVSAYATTTVIILAGISGCFMPRQWLPDLMQQISLATPHAWALIAYDQLLSTARPNLNTAWQSIGMLAGFAVTFFVVGGTRFRTLD
jgi:ABC-2 type transport system permease protein